MDRLQDAIRSDGESGAIDLFERDEQYLIVIDLPGVSVDGISIQANEELIHITARRDDGALPGEPIDRSERPDEIDIELPVPIDADHEAADASLANGILELRLPRVETTVDIPITEE